MDLLDIIAERSLELRTPGGTSTVLVQLGRPRSERDGRGPYSCGLRVHSPGRVLERTAVGIDGLEAIRVALQMVRQELLVDLPRLTGGTVSWQDVSAADAFPNQFPLPRGG